MLPTPANRSGSVAAVAPATARRLRPTILGEEQILIFNQDGLAAHNPADGQSVGLSSGVHPPHVSMPLILSENQVLLSLGYGNGSKLVELSKDGDQFTTKQLWHSRRMKAKFTNLIHHNDHVFGLDDGIFACMELNRTAAWKDGRYGHGQILLRNNILVMAEMGEIILLEANPEKHSELTRSPRSTQDLESTRPRRGIPARPQS